MSKESIAAATQQGCSSSSNLTKAHNSVKEIENLLANEVVLPFESAVAVFGQLEALFKTLGDIASAPIDARSDHAAARCALMRIKALSEAGAYLASDKGNFIDCTREIFQDKQIPAILATIGGAQ